jgi:hypothetical protein
LEETLSAYQTQSTVFEDKDSLVKGLGENGYGLNTVEVHDTPQTLYDYCGHPRPQKAHIILRRQFVWTSVPFSGYFQGGAANDIGFLKNTDGTYTAIISEYDSMRHNAAWITNLTKSYAKHALIKQGKRMGLTFLGVSAQKGTGRPIVQFRKALA